MKRQTSTGSCGLCRATFGKAAMTRHLQSCLKIREVPLAGPGGRPRRPVRIFHLVVAGRWSPGYWMHLAVPVERTLGDLDSFLRYTWLECCGHLSAFRIGTVSYDSGGMDEGESDGMESDLGSVLAPGTEFLHEYDFGTTTELRLKVVGAREGAGYGRDIEVLARNDPPDIRCEACNKPATQVCSQCICDGPAWFCDKCAKQHECGEEMCLPVVNSPRVGMCGYTGPSTAW